MLTIGDIFLKVKMKGVISENNKEIIQDIEYYNLPDWKTFSFDLRILRLFVQLKFRHFESCRQNLKPDKQKYMALVRILNLFTWLGNNKKQSCKICLLLCCQI